VNLADARRARFLLAFGFVEIAGESFGKYE
jgi:hypothetical protein